MGKHESIALECGVEKCRYKRSYSVSKFIDTDIMLRIYVRIAIAPSDSGSKSTFFGRHQT